MAKIENFLARAVLRVIDDTRVPTVDESSEYFSSSIATDENFY